MGESRPTLDAKVYFGALSVLLVEANELESEILAQILGGFKVRGITRLSSTDGALRFLERDAAQLILVGATEREQGAPDEFDFVRSVRKNKIDEVRLAAVILLTGHTLQSNVLRARDCGASFVVAKPITPRTLYDRIVWLAKDKRPFVNSASYAGPDRRVQKLGPPPGKEGRRHDDLSLEVGEAKVPNLSQSEIDAMLSGKGVVRP